MHRVSDIAKLVDLYHDASEEDRAAAVKTATTELLQTVFNLGKPVKGRNNMERTRLSKNLAATTRDVRAIAREAHKLGLNRQLTPAQFKLLDPKGTHILSPQMYHDKADGKPVDEHIRVYAHIKLIGKKGAIEKQLDVPSQFLTAYITPEEAYDIREYSKAIRSIEAVDSVVDASAEGNS